jgi:hypothetical protein
MTTEQLAALKEVAEKAIDAPNAPNWLEHDAAIENFRAEWTPANCKALLEEVERLTKHLESINEAIEFGQEHFQP